MENGAPDCQIAMGLNSQPARASLTKRPCAFNSGVWNMKLVVHVKGILALETPRLQPRFLGLSIPFWLAAIFAPLATSMLFCQVKLVCAWSPWDIFRWKLA